MKKETGKENFYLLKGAKIRVFGVGGGGSNSVVRMKEMEMKGVDFLACNTDAQALEDRCREIEKKLQIGPKTTGGLGAGADPEVGKAAALESIKEIEAALKGLDMVFITAGMGGGTGTGAAPEIARIAKENGILTVAVVTTPFSFEGKKRATAAKSGIEEIQKNTDSVIVISNERLLETSPPDISLTEAFRIAEGPLQAAIFGIADLITVPGLINLDFADIKTILKDSGLSSFGIGEAKGEGRAIKAAEAAVNCPLIESSIEEAKGVIINISGGHDLTLKEVNEAAEYVQSQADEGANIIFGASLIEDLKGTIRVSVILTQSPKSQAKNEKRLAPSIAKTLSMPVAPRSQTKPVIPTKPGNKPPAATTQPAVKAADTDGSAADQLLEDINAAPSASPGYVAEEDSSFAGDSGGDDLEVPAFLKK